MKKMTKTIKAKSRNSIKSKKDSVATEKSSYDLVNTLVNGTKIVALGLIVAVGLSYAFAWTAPDQAPPVGNVSAPVNVGLGDQYKPGAFGVGGVFETDNDAHFALFGGNVGIGTATPASKLDVNFSSVSTTVGRESGISSNVSDTGEVTGGYDVDVTSGIESYVTRTGSTGGITVASGIFGSAIGIGDTSGGSNSVFGGRFEAENSKYVTGVEGTAHTDTDIRELAGASGIVNLWNPGGSAVNAYGLYSSIMGGSDTTVQYSHGVYVEANNDYSNKTNNYGVYIESPLNYGQTIGRDIGLYIQNRFMGDDRYSIYSAGGKSYFKDSIGIGTANPQRDLHIGDGTGEAWIKLTSNNLDTKSGIEFDDDLIPDSELWKLERFSIDDTMRFTKMGQGNHMVIEPGGDIGIGGIINPDANLDIGGDLRISGDKICYYSCYTSGTQVFCDKKRFDTDASVETGVYMGFTSSITPNVGEGQLVTCSY